MTPSERVRPAIFRRMRRAAWTRYDDEMKIALAMLVAATGLLGGCGGGGSGAQAPVPVALPVAPHTGAPGSIDIGFAGTGVFVFPPSAIPGSYTAADSAAELESGKLVLSGTHRQRAFGSLRIGLLARLLPDGTLDRSMLGTGFLDFTGNPSEDLQATRVIPLHGDDLVWAHFDASLCFPACGNADPHPLHLFTRRMLASRTVDSTYGIGGTATGHMRPRDLAGAPDGSIVAFGEGFVDPAISTQPAIIAFDANGKPIPDAHLPDPPQGRCDTTGLSLPLQMRAGRTPDGKVMGLWVTKNATGADICLVRLDARGNPDPSFGIGGFAAIAGVPGADVPVAILPRRDGGSVGVFVIFDTNVRGNELVFFDAAGNLDTSRGDGGVHRDVETGMRTVTAAALQPDEKILIAGITLEDDRAGISRIARYDSTGAIDRTFGPQGTGVGLLAAGARTLIPASLLVASDWSIFVAGTTGVVCPGPPGSPCDPQSMAMMKLIGGDR